MADTTRLVTTIVFVIGVLLWVAFGALALLRPDALTELWTFFLGQPWPLQAMELVLFLPWIVALWVWSTAWELWLRVVLIAVLAVVTIALLAPRNRHRRRVTDAA